MHKGYFLGGIAVALTGIATILGFSTMLGGPSGTPQSTARSLTVEATSSGVGSFWPIQGTVKNNLSFMAQDVILQC